MADTNPLRPLSPHAIAELRNMAYAPEPACAINPGVLSRLLREGLIEIVQAEPYAPLHVRLGSPSRHLKAVPDDGPIDAAPSNGT